MSQPTSTTPTPLRLLLLHGYTQSGPLFRTKTRALEKSLTKHLRSLYPSHFSSVSLTYPTAPLRIRPADIPGHDLQGTEEGARPELEGENYGWWVRRGEKEPYVYEGIERGLEAVAQELKGAVDRGEVFDGVVGFSQGGALGGMVASLLEAGRREAFARLSTKGNGGMPWPESFNSTEGGPVHPPLKFAVSYSGFGATTNALYMPFYEPKIQTPMLHFLGSVDTVVEEERSLRLVRSCVDGGEGGVGRDGRKRSRVVRHPGGHVVPSASAFVGVLAEFVGECMGWEARDEGEKKEERVEDMDVPF